MSQTRSVVIAGVFVMVGCGGGGGGGSSTPTGKPDTLDFGVVTAAAVGAVGQPVIIGSRNAVFTGVAGGSFSDVRIRYPAPGNLDYGEALANTMIAYDIGGRPWLYDYGTGRSTPVTEDLAEWSNTSQPSLSQNRVAYLQWVQSPAWTQHIFTSNLDGTNRRQLTTGSVSSSQPTFSPDGTKIAFGRVDGGFNRIFVMPVGGGAAVPVSPAGITCLHPCWKPDGTRIGFVRGTSGAYYYSHVKPDGSDIQDFAQTSATSVHDMAWTASGRDIVTTARFSTTYQLMRLNAYGGVFYYLSGEEPINDLSVSPYGDHVIVRRNGANAGLVDVSINDGSSNTIQVGEFANSPSWGPMISSRTMVGLGGLMGTNAAGFIFSQIDKKVPSFVAFNATTRSTATIQPATDPNPNQANTVVNLSADQITWLKYVNDVRSGVASIVPQPSGIVGAIVGFTSDSGEVVSVVPYKGAATQTTARSSQGQITYRGDFTGIWDREGKNVAPTGGKEISIDPTTGIARVVR